MRQKTSSVLGYYLSVQDDDSYMLGPDTYWPPKSAGFHDWRFGKDGVPHLATCRTCGRKIDLTYINPAFRATGRKRDISTTYDGYTLVSIRFRNFCESQRWTGLEFVTLPADREFFVLRIQSIVAFDAERRGTRFEELCPTCGAFYSVVGATPVFLKDVKSPLQGGFFRTDLEFASGPEQYPLELVGVDVAAVLRHSVFRHFQLEPIQA